MGSDGSGLAIRRNGLLLVAEFLVRLAKQALDEGIVLVCFA